MMIYFSEPLLLLFWSAWFIWYSWGSHWALLVLSDGRKKFPQAMLPGAFRWKKGVSILLE